jgi:rhodanese-related sulfurtransferase
VTVAILGLFALWIAGCSSGSGRVAEQPPAGAPDRAEAPAADTTASALATHMAPEEVATFMRVHPEALLLDVRQPEEWDDALGHIDGARQIPLPELSGRLAEIDAWKSKPIITVCRSGRRSEIARKALVDAGFEQVANMDGGMLAWRQMEPK